MAAALADDAGAAPDDLSAILLASTLVRGNAAVTRRWIGRGAPPEDLVGTQLAVIDLAVGTFGRARPRRTVRRRTGLGNEAPRS
jgi:hypothetical protein